MSDSLGELAAEYERLTLLKKKAATDEKELNLKLGQVAEQLMDALTESHLKSIKTDGGMNLHIRTERYFGVNYGDAKTDEQKESVKARLTDALANCPKTMHLVKPDFNMNSLRSLLNEMNTLGDEWPPEIMALIKVTEIDKIGHR